MQELISKVHPEWKEIVEKALNVMDKDYLIAIQSAKTWLPGLDNLLNAFSLPLSKTNYILLGESPYPRPQSANGYAFWDNAVGSLWSSNGLSKEVNRATSLRNWLKTLLVARGDLDGDFSKEAIAKLNKSSYWQTAAEFFSSLMNKGFLLLNATLVYEEGKVQYHAKHWLPFMDKLLEELSQIKPEVELILFGKIAEKIKKIDLFPCLIAEHPYNLSFITNKKVQAFFKPLDLLNRHV